MDVFSEFGIEYLIESIFDGRECNDSRATFPFG